MRKSGILLPITSLPSKYGIGRLSKEAFQFIDQLKNAKQKIWQILPLVPIGGGDSPYQSYSTFAGNPLLIDLDQLITEGLLEQYEVDSINWGDSIDFVDYDKVRNGMNIVLYKAFKRFKPILNPDYFTFCKKNEYWLEDFSLYMSIKDENDGKMWCDWEDYRLKMRYPDAVNAAKLRLGNRMDYYKFQQYKFYQQWLLIKTYANLSDIEIFGDLPIYVSLDSSDVWCHQQLFKLWEGKPTEVAGCPPDDFAEDGQLWNNPLYYWPNHKMTNYSWWVDRIKHCFELYDIVRLDHFRGFDECYSIPYGETTARYGYWKKGPGMELFNEVKRKLGNVKLIAEDLGLMTDGVRQLLKDSGFPGMKVLQFAFGYGDKNEQIPANYETTNCVAYTGTHDNNTLKGWWETASNDEKELCKSYFEHHNDIYWEMIKLVMTSKADTCIIPMQDYLGLDEHARMNTPGTVGINWKWRMKPEAFRKDLIKRIRLLTEFSNR